MSTDYSTKPLPSFLYKIVPEAPVPTANLPHTLPLSELDSRDGYIHLSTAIQTPLTADRFFSASDTLNVLKIDVKVANTEAKVQWDHVAGHEDPFAHLYNGRLGAGIVIDSRVYKREEGESWAQAVSKRENVEPWLVQGELFMPEVKG